MSTTESDQIQINGSTVNLRLTVGRVLKGRKNGSDLGDLENGPLAEMFTDPSLLARTVWNVYGDRLQDAGVESEESFYDQIDGQLLREIESAMKAAIEDFFSWGSTVVEKISSHLEKLGETIDLTMQTVSGRPSGKLPESSESIPES